MSNNDTLPLVSVRLMTYNHQPYIAEAIEGCLMQQTNFPFEIVIGDDFSTDGTREICEQYATKYPDKISLLDRPIGGDYWKKRQELGRLYNFTNIIDNCKGKYIALLDGDDYWIDDKKIQKQVDLLNLNKDCSLCFHGSMIKINEDLKPKDYSFLQSKIVTQLDLLSLTLNNFIHSATLMFDKEELTHPLPNWFYYQPFGDWALGLILLKNKNGYFESENMSVYRRDGQGLWSNTTEIQKILKKRDFISSLYYSGLEIKSDSVDKIKNRLDIELDKIFLALERNNYHNLSSFELFEIIIKQRLFN